MFILADCETESTIKGLTTLIPLITALIAVISAPFIAIYTLRKQSKMQAVVLQRRANIKELRDLFSEFCSQLIVVNSKRGSGKLSDSEAYERLEEVLKLETKISFILSTMTGESSDYTNSVMYTLDEITEWRVNVFCETKKYDPSAFEEYYMNGSKAMTTLLVEEQKKIVKLK